MKLVLEKERCDRHGIIFDESKVILGEIKSAATDGSLVKKSLDTLKNLNKNE